MPLSAANASHSRIFKGLGTNQEAASSVHPNRAKCGFSPRPQTPYINIYAADTQTCGSCRTARCQQSYRSATLDDEDGGIQFFSFFFRLSTFYPLLARALRSGAVNKPQRLLFVLSTLPSHAATICLVVKERPGIGGIKRAGPARSATSRGTKPGRCAPTITN